MLTFLLKRLLGLLPTLLIVSVLVFLFVHLLPGDPARLAAGQDADAQTVALSSELGTDFPEAEALWAELQADREPVDEH
ncbi:hypothetical protein OMR07_23270 [Methylobacterium organophilum]|nr:hypothetical protein [Methylobacterium organophilum]